MRSIPLVLASLACAVAASAQEGVDARAAHRIKGEALDRSKVMETAFYLTDVHGPRLTGSPAFRRAGEWALEQLRSFGLSNVHAEPFQWGRGWSASDFSVQLVQPQFAALIGNVVPWSLSTNGAVTGDVVLAPLPRMSDTTAADYDAFFARNRGRLRGKIVLANAPVARDPVTEILKSLPDSAFAASLRRGELRQSAASPGLPAWQVAAYARVFWDQQDRLNRFLRTEGVLAILYQGYGTDGTVYEGIDERRTQPEWLRNPSRELPPASVTLAAEHYLRLARLVQHNPTVRLRISVRSDFHSDSDAAFNIVAELPGTDLRDEVVLIGAHFDSWAAATGATDNAAGSAVVMEAMRILKALDLKPRRTIRAVLWGGHEGPGKGTRTYIRDHYVGGLPTEWWQEMPGTRSALTLRPDHAKVAAYFNMDFGAGRIRGIFAMGDERLRPIFSAWLAPFADMGAAHVSMASPTGSDHEMFREFGLPGFPFIQDTWPPQWRTHHSNMDLYDYLSEDHLKQSAAIMAAIAYFAAMRDEKLPRAEP